MPFTRVKGRHRVKYVPDTRSNTLKAIDHQYECLFVAEVCDGLVVYTMNTRSIRPVPYPEPSNTLSSTRRDQT